MRRLTTIKKAVAKRLSLAPEAAGCMRMTLTDDNAVCIENYQSIVEYTQKRVRVHIGAYDILVRGTQLVLSEFGSDIVMICGRISAVEYNGGTR